MAGRSKGTVGVVGLGNMGGAFAKHLAAAGWRVFGYDIDAGRKRAAKKAGVEIAPDVRTLAAAAPVIILSLPHVDALAATVAEIAKDKLPSVYGFREFVDAGGLAYYGANYRLEFRRMADYVDKILNGIKAGDLPIQQPTTFELVLNRKTADALGIAIPAQLEILADEVIE
jgi:ABC-type uncharacterized transport system substrate-binding protein